MAGNKRIIQYGICLVAIVVIILYILTLVGCTSKSPGLPGLYLVRLSNNETLAEVRVGLFGICAGVGGLDNLTCAGTVGQNLTTSSSTSQFFLPGSDSVVAPSTLQPLLNLAMAIQSENTGAGGINAIVYVPLIIGSIFFVAAISALLAHDAMGGNGSQKSTMVKERAWSMVDLLGTYSVAAATGGAAAASIATRALQFAGTEYPGTALSQSELKSSSTIVVDGGVAIQMLPWFVVVLTLIWHSLMTLLWRRMAGGGMGGGASYGGSYDNY